MKCLFTKIQSNIAIWQYIAIHSNAIRNTALIHIVSPLECTYTVWKLMCTQDVYSNHIHAAILESLLGKEHQACVTIHNQPSHSMKQLPTHAARRL